MQITVKTIDGRNLNVAGLSNPIDLMTLQTIVSRHLNNAPK
jgi:hypothetical protein